MSKFIVGPFKIGDATLQANAAGVQIDGLNFPVLLIGSATMIDVDVHTGALPVPSVAGSTAAGAAIAAQQAGFVGELSFVAHHGGARIDAQSNLIEADGSRVWPATPGEPLPKLFDDVEQLIDWAQATAYSYAIMIDGIQYHIGAEPATRYGSRADGKLELMGGLPHAPTVALAPAPAGSDIIVDIAMPVMGQVRPGTTGFGSNALVLNLDVPADLPAFDRSHLGFLKVFEKSGQQVTTRHIDIGELYQVYSDTGTTLAVAFTIDNPSDWRAAGAAFNIQPGTRTVCRITNPGMVDPVSDVWVDVAGPGRY